MERPNTIQLAPAERPVIDYILASRCIKPVAGRFYAVEYPQEEKLGRLFLPDAVSQSFKSDLVVVIAVGEGVDYKPGDIAAVLPTAGSWLEGAVFGAYKAEGRVRVYGLAWDELGDPIRVPWDDCAPLQIEGDMFIPKRTKVLMRRDPVIEKEGSLLLTDADKYRPCTATIVALGPRVCDVAPELKVGDRIHYDALAAIELTFAEDPDLAVIDCVGIHGGINEEVAA